MHFEPDDEPEPETGSDPATDPGVDAPRRARRRLPRWALIAGAVLLGTLAALGSSHLLAREMPRDARDLRGDASRLKRPDPRRSPGVWPRPLPREPGQWLRQNASECGLMLTGLRTEAHATTFPAPSGTSVVLWEVSMRMGAEGVVDDVRALMDRLTAAPCGINVPELTLTWIAGNRVKIQLQAVLLGTWPDRPSGATRRGT